MLGGDEVGAMVLDIGTSYSRVGFAGEDVPKAVFQTPVGVLLDEAAEGGKRHFVARQKYIHRENMEISSPVVNGLVEDWDALEAIWSYALRTHLSEDVSEHPLMIAEANDNTADKREKMMELAFEKFNAPAAFLCKAAVLTAFSMGRPTALVLDSGGGNTTACPVHDGILLHKGLTKSCVGGETMDAFIEKTLFTDRDARVPARYAFDREVHSSGGITIKPKKLSHTTASFDAYMKRNVVQDLKESKILRVTELAFNPARMTNLPAERFELPDGKVLDIGSERFSIPENLFRPSNEFKATLGDGNEKFDGLHTMVKQSIDACDVDIRKELYNYILLSGGNALFPSMSQRLSFELEDQLPPALKAKIMPVPTSSERQFGAWVGGSILGSLGSFHQMWFSKAEYEENGASLLANKCP